MANPLSMYVPIKQDAQSQAIAAQLATQFVSNVQATLDQSQIVHYAKMVLIPNPSGSGTLALLLSTEFDGSMNSYLKFFWNNGSTQEAFAGLAALALVPPDPPVTDLTGFETFVNATNISQPADLYQAYTKTVLQINATVAAEQQPASVPDTADTA
ncbi:MAG TPA: hypothetical protein VEK57_26555 [Thermoanaerobaculia bacterium]|nr:hypothetical protein [Thermoanaerobaculia bacterium]